MRGLQRLVRRDILTRLKADAGLVAIVPATQIHSVAPLVAPTWPFIKLGPPHTVPRRAAGLVAGDVTIGVHAFARARLDGSSAMVETAEDHASRIGEAIEAVLDDKGGNLSAGVVRYRLIDHQLLVDAGEETAFHWFANVRARVTAS